MDSIIIPDLPVRCHVGITEEERQKPQELRIWAELFVELGPAGRTDDFNQTVDYAAACMRILELARARPRALIETIAEETADALLNAYALHKVRVEVRKPSALARFGIPYAAVRVERRRDV